MASDNEASCESDPNFAVICSFLEKFSVTCGLGNIDFVDLQYMLENTQEASQELIELHVKLMRRARRSVSSNSKWERALIKTCHTFSSKLAWEIERFGYKKVQISTKLRVLKELLEMQFDYNQKFKNEINKISAVDLRTQPLGRDRMGRSYWYQCDESCQIRVYKDDPDDETWTLVAKDREGLVSLISQLGNGDATKSSSEPVSNEDSNSVEVEKPILDTGQIENLVSKQVLVNLQQDEGMEIETECTVSNRTIIDTSEDANLPDTEINQEKAKENVAASKAEKVIKESVAVNMKESNAIVAEDKEDTETINDEVENVSDEKIEKEKKTTSVSEEKIEKEEKTKSVSEEKIEKEKKTKSVSEEKIEKEETTKSVSEEKIEKEEKTSVNNEIKTPEESENALNLCSKDLSSKTEKSDDKTGLDLSVKSAPCLRIKPITELMAQPQHLEVQKKDFIGIKGKYIRNEHGDKGILYPNPMHCGKAVQSASYDAICYKRSMEENIYSMPTNLKHPRFDRPTLLGNPNYMPYLNEEEDDEELEDEEIEEPLMLVQGEGSGFPNQSTNQIEMESPIVEEAIEDPVFYVHGEGNGEDCDTGNNCENESKENNSKQSVHQDNAVQSKTTSTTNFRKKTSGEESIDNNTEEECATPDDIPNDSLNSPVKQTFFFGNSFSPSTSPVKTASLSFGASIFGDPQKSQEFEAVDGHPFEKTDENLVGINPSSTKVPENVNTENVDNNTQVCERLLPAVKTESVRERNCDTQETNTTDCNVSEITEEEHSGDGEVIKNEKEQAKSDSDDSQATNLDDVSSSINENVGCSTECSNDAKETSESEESANSQDAANIVEDNTTPIQNEVNCEEENYEITQNKRGEGNLSSVIEKETTTTEDNLKSTVNENELTTTKTNLPSTMIQAPSSVTEAKLTSTAIEAESSVLEENSTSIQKETTTTETNSTSIPISEESTTTPDPVETNYREKDVGVLNKSDMVLDSPGGETDVVKIITGKVTASKIDLTNKENDKLLDDTPSPKIDAKEVEGKTVKDKINPESDSMRGIDAGLIECYSESLNNSEHATTAEVEKQGKEDSDSLLKPSENTTDRMESTKYEELSPTVSIDTEENKDLLCENKKRDVNNETKVLDAIKSNDNEADGKTNNIEEAKVDLENSDHEDGKPKDNTVKEAPIIGVSEGHKESQKPNLDILLEDTEPNQTECPQEIIAPKLKIQEGSVKTNEEREDKVGEAQSVKVKGDNTVNIKTVEEIPNKNEESGVNDAEKVKTATEKESAVVENEEHAATSDVILVNDDDGDNLSGPAAIKAIKITNVQSKCEILEDMPKRDDHKTRNEVKAEAKALQPQPLRFLRGRRPNQMLSVKSYATRNKNLVLRKEIKPQIQPVEKTISDNEEIPPDPLLKIIKSEEIGIRRSARRKPGESIVKNPVPAQPEPVTVEKRGRGRQKKIVQPQKEQKQIEESDLRHSKRLRLSNNQIPAPVSVETIDLTSEHDGKKISVRNCNENVVLKGGITINPIFRENELEKKSAKKNGPFLTCVNIQKLKENPLDHAESPVSVASSGGGDNSDVVIIEDDPLAVPDPCETSIPKAITLNSFQLDAESPPPPSVPLMMTRSLRKRGITEPEVVTPSGGKRRKTKGKRQVDLELRRSIEEQKKQEVCSSSSSDDEKKQKPQPYKKKQEVVEPVKKVKKPRAQRKKTLMGLEVPPEVLAELNASIGSVRQSRRIAQLKIREEAERRKLEETDSKDSKRRGKKEVDKDYKAEKRKRTKPPTEEEQEEVTVVEAPVVEEEKKKKRRKRKRKDRDPRKIFDESNPWRSSSDSSTSNNEVEEEEEDIAEYSEADSPLFKSDHEFSPESDVEDAGEPQPLKRARTARKEDDVDDIDEHACQKCGKSDHPEWILLCDGCDNGWHCSCLRPALFIIPEGDWFCPPCQHATLVKQLEEKLAEYDRRMAKKEIEVRRKERLAYVGISLANVLPVKDAEEKRKKKSDEEDEDEEDSDSSESSSSSDSDEPIYQLRQRRQAHSYRFNDYDDLINSAIQEEMEAVKGAGNQGRGKDISTIVNAEKEAEPLPPVVPEENKELPPAVVPPPHSESEEERVKPVKKKFLGRKKQRKLNSLDVSSGDDPDSDEDFKGSSTEEEEEDDFEEDQGSDSSEAYGRRRRGMPVRRSTRARTSRYDKDFINDDDSEEEVPRKKKSRAAWDESESEESDRSWGRRANNRRKSRRATTGSRKKRSKKSKNKNYDESDEDRSKKKKRRIKYGGLDDDDEEEQVGARRTRGKKINYADVLASDSEEEIKKKAPPRIESDDDYVANEDPEQEEDEEFEKEESVEKEERVEKEESVEKEVTVEKEATIEKEATVEKAKSVENEENVEKKDDPGDNAKEPEQQEKPQSPFENPPPAETKPPSPEKSLVEEVEPATAQEENFDLDNLNSSIDDLPDDLAEDNDDDDTGLNPIDEINKNLEEMDEEEMEKLMEEEEYANKQLQLMAMQLEKEKKRKEREARKKELAAAAGEAKTPKRRPRKNKQVDAVQIRALQVGPDMQSNTELSEPPGITIPLFGEISPSVGVDGSPKKRRGRGKGKKTLEKEAAAAAAAAAVVGASSVPPNIASETPDEPHIPTTVDTVAGISGNDDMSLANAAAMHGAKLAIAAPPQPFSQTQPSPSVITRMLQAQPGPGQSNYSPMGHNYYADQPPAHAENSTQIVSNAQMPAAVPVSNNLAANHSSGPLPSMSQGQQQPYMHGAPPVRGGMSSTVYRQPPPNVNPYHRSSPAPPVRVRTPAPPSIPNVYHAHHPLDPSPSGGGPINVPTPSAINTPDRSSPVSIPPSSDSPLSNKSDPTPPPPPYSRPQMRFSNVTATTPPMSSSPIRQQSQQNLLPPQHLQQQTSPLRNSSMPYHPASMPTNYYGGFMPGNMASEEALPPTGYQYSDQFSETDSPQDLGKSYDEENSGEFGGLVSYFSSQREDDLDT